MVVKFLELYRPEKLRDKICDDESLRRNFTWLMDDNQLISERQARLVASHDSLRVLLTKRAGLEATDVHGAIQKNISVSSIVKYPMSYLYFIGALAVAEPRTDALVGEPTLKIPNAAAQFNFVESYLGHANIVPATEFCRSPSVATLTSLLDELTKLKPPFYNQTEADLEATLGAVILWKSPLMPNHQQPPGICTGSAGRPQGQDLVIDTQNHYIILEVESIPGRDLKDAEFQWVEGATEHQQEARKVLSRLSVQELENLSSSKGNISTQHLQIVNYRGARPAAATRQGGLRG
jgi:hypothetical protein